MNNMFSETSFYAPGDNGSYTLGQIAELQKALLAPGSVDDLYGTPGGVITNQSLEMTLVDLTLKSTDYTFWQDVNKVRAGSTVEEYDIQIGQGISYGGFVPQIGNPEFRDIDILKEIAIMKYMSEGWTAGDVQQQVGTIVDARARAQRGAVNRILRNLNRAAYSANSAWNPLAFNGLAATIAASSSQQIFDIRGGNLSMNTFNIIGQLITEGNGRAENSKIYVSPSGIQNLSKIIETGATETGDRKIVEMGQQGITIGGKIANIMTAFGPMQPRMDKILGMEYESKQVPQYYNNATGMWVEGATSELAPSLPTVGVAVVGATPNSQFAAGTVRPSGTNQRYRVSACNSYGRGLATAIVETSGAVAAGGSVTITITPNTADSGSKLPTCFEIYGEKDYNSGIFRYLYTVAADTDPLAQVTYTDKNDYIPGTARMFVIDQTTSGEDRVMAYSQLLPIHNTDLAKTGRFEQGLVNLYITPKYYKKNVLVEIRNIGVDQSSPNLFNEI